MKNKINETFKKSTFFQEEYNDHYLQALKQAPIFTNIDQTDIIKALGCLNPQIKKYRPGEYVFSEFDQINEIGIILEGEAQIQKLDYQGNKNIIAKLYPSMMMGMVAYFTKTMVFNVEAISDLVVLMIDPKQVIQPCHLNCRYHLKIIENLLTSVIKINYQLTNKINILTKRSIREKILTYLLSLKTDPLKNKITISFTHQQLADYLSVNRSALSRELAKMRQEQIIDYQDNWFMIKN